MNLYKYKSETKVPKKTKKTGQINATRKTEEKTLLGCT